MKALRSHLSPIMISLAELLIGMVLLFRPVGFTTIVMVAVGAVLVVKGAVNMINYLVTAAVTAQKEQLLARGMTSAAAGIFCVVKSEWLIATFPALTALYGAAILVMGFYKIQHALDLHRQKKPGTGLAAITAAVAIAFAVLILVNPFTSAALLWNLTAVGLIIEAVLDIAAIVLDIRKSNAA